MKRPRRGAFRDSQFNADLNRLGFHVLRGRLPFTVPRDTLSAIASELLADDGGAQERIFNGGGGAADTHERCGDGRRRQAFFELLEPARHPVADAVGRRVRAALGSLDVPLRDAHSHVFILSEAGCAQQPPHTDLVPESSAPAADDGTAEGWTCGALVALEPDTRLVVWPRTTRARTTVALDAGDVLVFRGDLVHAGAAYPERANVRVHFFLDNPRCRRGPNDTNEVAMAMATMTAPEQ